MPRWLLEKPTDSDESPIATAGKLVLTSTAAIKQRIGDHARKIAKNEDLSDAGKQKRLAKMAADEIGTYRAAKSRAVDALRDQKGKAQNRRKDASTTKFSFEERKMIAEYMRSVSRDERTNLLRQAAAGKVQGADLIMATALDFPAFLVGYGDEDLVLVQSKQAYLARVAPQAISELADLEEAELALNFASEELTKFGNEVAGPAFDEALAVFEGRKPWSELTRDEKLDAVAAGVDIADARKHGVQGLDWAGPAEESNDPKWGGLSLEQKIAAVQRSVDDGESIASLVN